MKNIIILIFITLIPLLIDAQDVKTTANADSLLSVQHSNNSLIKPKEIQINESIRYNMFKIAAFLYDDNGTIYAIFSLGFEFKVNERFSCEVVGCINEQSNDAGYTASSIRTGLKYYFTKKHNPYVSMFLRYQKFDYANDDPDNKIKNATGYGVGCMLGSMLKFSNVVKMDIGMGLFYSYRVPAYNHQFDTSVIGQGIYLIPRVHLSFCF